MAHLGATEIAQRLGDQSYVADRGLASALSVAFQLRRPLFLEGEAGVGRPRWQRRSRPRSARA